MKGSEEDSETVDLPCPSIGGIYGDKSVVDCQMACGHHKVLSKISACTDTSGDITNSQCFSKGISSGQKCMWTKFVAKDGSTKSHCGPCTVGGIGKIPCLNIGEVGPEGLGSETSLCLSQCDDDCWGPTNCRPTEVPPPVIPKVVPLDAMNIHTSKGAPKYYAMPVDPPYGAEQYYKAAQVAARTAGWPIDAKMPPQAPIVIYGPPPYEGPTLPPSMPVMYGPAPPGIPGVPPPGYGFGTAPPKKMVEAAAKQRSFLALGKQNLRHWGAPRESGKETV